MNRLLLKNTFVLKPDNEVEQTDILIEGSYIHSIGKADESWKPDKEIDCTDMFAIPGFINTHTHASMSYFRSYADDMSLMDWLQNKIWPLEDKLTSEDIYWGSLLAIAEMIKSGTTTFTDMYFHMPQTAHAVEKSGIRAVLSRGMAGISPNGQTSLQESMEFYRDFHGAANERISVMLGPHAPYTCPPDYLRKVVDAAEKLNAEIHIHLSETKGEVEDCLKQYGKTPIQLMNDLGVFDRGVLAAHCVHVSAADIEIMRQKQVRVAHCPGSNTKLASGIAPIPAMLAAGLTVGLGTDSAASNNNLDMLEEIRLAALVHKANTLDPTIIAADNALLMGTSWGAEAVGLGSITGKLKKGYKADITLFNTKGLTWLPKYDLKSLLVYSVNSGDVDTVIIDGKLVLVNKVLTTIDEEELAKEINSRFERLTAL